jgi:hypothetical protein
MRDSTVDAFRNTTPFWPIDAGVPVPRQGCEAWPRRILTLHVRIDVLFLHSEPDLGAAATLDLP